MPSVNHYRLVWLSADSRAVSPPSVVGAPAGDFTASQTTPCSSVWQLPTLRSCRCVSQSRRSPLSLVGRKHRWNIIVLSLSRRVICCHTGCHSIFTLLWFKSVSLSVSIKHHWNGIVTFLSCVVICGLWLSNHCHKIVTQVLCSLMVGVSLYLPFRSQLCFLLPI